MRPQRRPKPCWHRLHAQPGTVATDRPASVAPATPPGVRAAVVPSELPETVIPDDPALDADRPHRPAPQRLTHPDWLFHRFSVSGSRVEVAAFRAAAAGAATI